MGTQFISPKTVCERVALSRATIDRLVAAGKFPQPIRITEHRIVYKAHEVQAWIEEKAAA